ncbi:YihY/virulence factor BrkB family protein [Streptomyces sp. NBC_00557]|uniref:YihY/virulence factor BrkB family protein n=1 Tax=Streptomyces sp. NBC_00557 TaxID=2975776 RepID=UPI002E8148D1|nr:YihY/virulence factor BrkB family protein [Streptomyces sp. NBC_00557]WUC34064.1 YihY/virulence factor BrkB family protein [Streptomyces sp. NBC_00557]
MQQASESPERPAGRLHRARVLYRNVSKRRTAWLLLKDTVNSCMEYRILGLAAEAAFFTLLSVPPLLLCLIGLLAYVDTWTGAHTISSLENNILEASRTVLSDKGVKEITEPILHDVMKGRPDVISIGFLFALWSGSRAVNVFIDTITVMYGLDGVRGIVKTRVMSFVLFIVALLIGSVALPLMVAGPDAVVRVVPWSATVVQVLYWPVVIVLSIAFLTTLYHVSVPVRSPWIEDVPGALVALAMWVLGSFLLRIYLVHTIEGATIYGSLAASVAVLLWIGVSAFAVLVGAAVNAAIDRVWPAAATAAARAANERIREAQVAEYVARAAAQRDADPDDPDMPSEFPERWSRFLPPEDVTARLRTHAKHAPKTHGREPHEPDDRHPHEPGERHAHGANGDAGTGRQ